MCIVEELIPYFAPQLGEAHVNGILLGITPYNGSRYALENALDLNIENVTFVIQVR